MRSMVDYLAEAGANEVQWMESLTYAIQDALGRGGQSFVFSRAAVRRRLEANLWVGLLGHGQRESLGNETRSPRSWLPERHQLVLDGRRGDDKLTPSPSIVQTVRRANELPCTLRTSSVHRRRYKPSACTSYTPPQSRLSIGNINLALSC